MRIKEIIKDNKEEILITVGSAAMLGVGTYCLVKSAKLKLNPDDVRLILDIDSFKWDALQDKAIVDAFATVEYIDGGIGIIKDVKAVAKALK